MNHFVLSLVFALVFSLSISTFTTSSHKAQSVLAKLATTIALVYLLYTLT